MTKQTSVVALVADGYQDLDFWYPVLRMQEAGFEVTIVGPEGRSPVHSGLGYPVIPHKAISDAPSGADLVLIPGGGAGDVIAHDAAMVAWVRRAHQAGGLVASVGTGNAVAATAGLGDSERLISAAGTAELPEHIAAVVRRAAQHN
jgi:protease I